MYLTAFGTFLNQVGTLAGAIPFFSFIDAARRNLASTLWAGFSGRIYAFKAERMNVSTYGLSAESVLYPNAANLPAVLADLFSKKPGLTRNFNEAVSQILPSIQLVQSRNVGSGHYRIFIQNRGTDPDRDDLTHSLEDCGAASGKFWPSSRVQTH